MMACRTVRTLLLDAEAEALRGEGASEAAEHVRTCPACAARAGIVLAETAAIDRFLSVAAPPLDVDAVLSAAGHRMGGGATTGHSSRAVPFPSWRRWVPLAAAAAVAGLLLLRDDPGLPPSSSASPAISPAPPLVEKAAHQNVAVLATANPEITVVWFFD